MRYTELLESGGSRKFAVTIKYEKGNEQVSRTFNISSVVDAAHAKRIAKEKHFPSLKNPTITKTVEVKKVNESEETDNLINSVLDLITPLASHGVEYITVDNLINRISRIPSGFHIDREMVMDLLTPDQFPIIKSIEGDKLYLKTPVAPERAVSSAQKDSEAKKIKDTAEKQAIKAAKE